MFVPIPATWNKVVQTLTKRKCCSQFAVVLVQDFRTFCLGMAGNKRQVHPTLKPMMRWSLMKMFNGVEYKQDRISLEGPVHSRVKLIFAAAIPFSQAHLAWAPRDNDTGQYDTIATR